MVYSRSVTHWLMYELGNGGSSALSVFFILGFRKGLSLVNTEILICIMNCLSETSNILKLFRTYMIFYLLVDITQNLSSGRYSVTICWVTEVATAHLFLSGFANCSGLQSGEGLKQHLLRYSCLFVFWPPQHVESYLPLGDGTYTPCGGNGSLYL